MEVPVDHSVTAGSSYRDAVRRYGIAARAQPRALKHRRPRAGGPPLILSAAMTQQARWASSARLGTRETPAFRATSRSGRARERGHRSGDAHVRTYVYAPCAHLELAELELANAISRTPIRDTPAVVRGARASTDEIAHVFLATGLSPCAAAPEPTEELAVARAPFAEALHAAVTGRMQDAITVAALLRVHHMAATGVLEPALARAVLGG